MKKLLLLSFVSVFIGLMSLVFSTSQLYAAPPFEVPPKGGLPVCMEDLDLCNSDLGTCDTDLGLLQNDLDLCNSDLDICDTNLTQAQDDLGTCEGNLAASDGFVDNGDGTVTDVRSGLMWEQKDNNGGIHDVGNFYSWSTNLLDPNGTLFTEFLDTLNNKCDGDESTSCSNDGDCTGIGNGLCGHAGYQDWRIPEVGRDSGSFELEAIVSLTQGFCGGGFGACISPVFGPTEASVYWSSTTFAIAFSPSAAWFVNFFNGNVNFNSKRGLGFARAVRP